MNDHPIYNTIITVYIFNNKLYLNQNITKFICARLTFCETNKHYSYKNKARFPNGKRALLRPDL